MKKQIILLTLFLFSFALMYRLGNAQATANTFSTTTTDTIIRNTSTQYKPEDVGMSAIQLTRIDSIVKDAIASRVFPGCQVLIMKEGKPIYDKCFGTYTYEGAEKVKPNTMYDLASLSKTTGTLLAIMKLYDNSKLKLTDKASYYLPFLRETDKENITIKELLVHESGLPASLPFYMLAVEKNNTPAYKFKQYFVSSTPSIEFTAQVSDSLYVNSKFHTAAMQMIADTHLNSKTYVYSCVNFILLKEIVETITSSPMDMFLDREYFLPMGLHNTAYLPLRTHKKEEIVPTLKRDFLRNGIIQGYVHDPDAAFLGGVSGNAGLFASAHDVASIHQMLLNDGEFYGKRYLSAETCRLFTTTTSASGRRALGFDKPVPTNPKYSPCCALAPQAVYGHTGYTGTCCWVDPVNKLVYVFLSNRTYPNDGVNKLAKMSIRPKIQKVIYQSIIKNP